jgi:hypothetical protein
MYSDVGKKGVEQKEAGLSSLALNFLVEKSLMREYQTTNT